MRKTEKLLHIHAERTLDDDIELPRALKRSWAPNQKPKQSFC